jgi:hypothetical protein
MFNAIVFFALVLILVTCACSRSKILTKDELRSELISARSLAAETDMFLDSVRESRATKNFAQGHIGYLTEEVERSIRELRESSPSPGEQDVLQKLREQCDSLKTELHRIRASVGDEAALATAKQHIATIRQTLDQLNSSI